jgi:hypothetical protein
LIEARHGPDGIALLSVSLLALRLKSVQYARWAIDAARIDFHISQIGEPNMMLHQIPIKAAQ